MKFIYTEKPKEYIAFQYTDGNEQELKEFFEESDIELGVYLRKVPNTLEIEFNKHCYSLYRNDWVVYCITTDELQTVSDKLFNRMFQQTNEVTI